MGFNGTRVFGTTKAGHVVIYGGSECKAELDVVTGWDILGKLQGDALGAFIIFNFDGFRKKI